MVSTSTIIALGHKHGYSMKVSTFLDVKTYIEASLPSVEAEQVLTKKMEAGDSVLDHVQSPSGSLAISVQIALLYLPWNQTMPC